MPEGPEIKRAADRVASAIQGQVAHRIEFAFERLQTYESELQSRLVTAVEARGKALITRFSDTDLRIFTHNQLYGRWITCKPDRIPKSNRSLRLAIHTDHRLALLYSASSIAILHNDQEERSHSYLSKLGPDLLHPQVTEEIVAKRLMDKRFTRRRLGGLLLDQSFLCGPGNYLRSEILFVAQIHPSLRPCDLLPQQRSRLAAVAINITRRAYRQRGVTLDNEIVSELKAAGATRRQYRHYVFAREGHACRECGDTVRKVAVSGRRLYFCPSCQPSAE